MCAALACAGALGALARWRLDGWARSATADAAPVLGKCGIVAVNVVALAVGTWAASVAAAAAAVWAASPGTPGV